MENSAQWESPLCSACKTVTYEMLVRGFKHSLTYEQTVESGKTCKLCRLMICSYSRLQVYDDMYDIEKNYDHWASKLPALAAVKQTTFPFIIQKMKPPPKNLQWTPNDRNDRRGIKGYFSEGATVQLSAPYGSCLEKAITLISNQLSEDQVLSIQIVRLYQHSKLNQQTQNGIPVDFASGSRTTLKTTRFAVKRCQVKYMMKKNRKLYCQLVFSTLDPRTSVSDFTSRLVSEPDIQR